VALVLLAQTAEQAELLPNLGEAAKLQDGNPSSNSLVEEMAKDNPDLDVTPTSLVEPPKTGAGALATQMAAMTDQNGNNPISGEIPETGKEVIIGTVPTVDANAILKAKEAQQAQRDAALKAGTVQWRSIPSFHFSEDGKQYSGLSEQECQDRCKNDVECISYSFNSDQNLCVQSKSCIQYDMEYKFYAKKKNGGGGNPFRQLGNMKYMVKGAGDTTTTAVPGVSPSACEQSCSEDAKCKSYAHRGRDDMCLFSSQDLGYSEDWTYAEKSGAAAALAEKQKEDVVKAEGAAGALPGSDGASTDNAKVSAALLAADRSALSPEQAALLKAGKKDTSDIRAILLDNIRATTAELTSDEQARLAAEQAQAEKAAAQAKVDNELNAKGQKVYDAAVASEYAKTSGAVEDAEKTGWKNSERGAKSEAAESEKTAKETQGESAETLRTKTEDAITATAQQLLEAKDNMGGVEHRANLFKEAMDNFNKLHTTVQNKLDFQKSEEARASSMIVQSNDEKKLNLLQAKADAGQTTMNDAQEMITAKNEVIGDANGKLPTLNHDKITAQASQTAAQGAVENTEQRIADEADAAVKSVLQSRLAKEKADEGAAKTSVTDIQKAITELTTKVTQAQRAVVDEDAKKTAGETEKDTAESEHQAERARLDKLKADGTTLMGSAKFKARQILSQEFTIKQDIANENRKRINFHEKDEKTKLNLADLEAKVKELEESRKEQDMEGKVKTSVKFQEHANKKQKKVDDAVTSAEEDEKRAVKLISDGQYAQASATSVADKVAASTKISAGESLKVQSEQKVSNLGPAKQAAKEAAEAADDKLQALKDSFKDDEAGYKKAMSKFKSATAKMEKATETGPLEIAKEEQEEQLKLDKERATMNGVDNWSAPSNMRDYSPSALSSKSGSSGVRDIPSGGNGASGSTDGDDDTGGKNPEAELRTKTLANRNKFATTGIDEMSAEAKTKKGLADQMNQKSTVETDTKAQIRALERKISQSSSANRVQEIQANEASEKESLQKKSVAVNANNAQLSPAQELEKKETEAQIQKYKARSEQAKEQTAKAGTKAGSTDDGAKQAGLVEDTCTEGSLSRREVCEKTKADEYDGKEKTAKRNAVNLQTQAKTQEGMDKSTEKQTKEGEEKTAQNKLKKTQEGAEKEAAQKKSMTEGESKEAQKKTNDKETAAKQKAIQDAQAKEEQEKALANMNQEERTKHTAQQEKMNKSKEAETKTQEKDTKEMSTKQEVTSKSESELGEKSGESIQKTGAANQDEANQKDSYERSQKTTQEGKDKSDAQLSQSQEKSQKNTNEGGVKTAAQSSKNAQAADEASQKQAIQSNNMAASNERSQKDKSAEETTKEGSQKSGTNELSTKENTTKSNSAELQQKTTNAAGGGGLGGFSRL
jgi:hypothetical protein